MGGPGSGRYSYSRKATTETGFRLDVRWLQRKGCLVEGYGSTLTWSRGGAECGSICLEIRDGRIHLAYEYSSQSQKSEPVEQTILLTRTSCHFGGTRIWLICPKCLTRVAVLFAPGKHFLCRHCYRLSYPSQLESASYRLMRKARKIRERLGADSSLVMPVFAKPKGMHWKTFIRLKLAEQFYNDKSLWLTARRLRL